MTWLRYAPKNPLSPVRLALLPARIAAESLTQR
jgi:hypothetical protein